MSDRRTLLRRTGHRFVWTGVLGVWSGAALAAAGAAPSQMSAVVQSGSGGPEVLKIAQITVPEPGDKQVRIRVYAAGVNPIDWKIRSGMLGGRPSAPGATSGPPDGPGGPPGGPTGGPPDGAPPSANAGGPPGGPGGPPGGPPGGGPDGPPGGGMGGRGPGRDVAGVIDAIGVGVADWKVGDPVYATLQLGGGYAQYAVANASDVARKPKNFSFAQASGIPTAGMTGLRAVNLANVQKGQTVVVIGAAGGVGSTVVQVAKARGAKVIAVASSQHNAYLKKIGADEIVNYDKEKVADKVKDIDVVISTAGSEANAIVGYAKKGGTVVSVEGPAPADQCTKAAVTCLGMYGPQSRGSLTAGQQLSELGKLAEAGRYDVKIEKTFPLDKAGEAQEFNRAGHAEGKVILAVTPDASKR